MSDWTTDAANAIDNAVGLVRERTVEPVQADRPRASPTALLAALILLPAVTLTDDRRLPAARRSRPDGHVWIAWTVLGGIFLIAGWFCWIKRNP